MEIKTNDYVRGILIADCSRRYINNRLLTAMTTHRAYGRMPCVSYFSMLPGA